MNEFIDVYMTYIRIPLEVAILAFLIYQTLYYLRGARASFVLAGVVVLLIGFTLFARLLKFDVINRLLESFWTVGALTLVVIFQPELRRAFAQLGSYAFWQRGRQREIINELVTASNNMAIQKCGALIIVECKIQMQAIVEDAFPLDIRVQAIILESIFFPNSPLHDGAIIIRDGKIVAAKAILPITRVENVSKRLGTRHRAAVGITEETDAVAIVVSEETGGISVASRGVLRRNVPVEKLHDYLEGLIIKEQTDQELQKTLGL